jgi:hypothetical protein
MSRLEELLRMIVHARAKAVVDSEDRPGGG